MPVMNWQTSIIDGQEFLVIDVAKLRIPLNWDPSSNVFIAVAAPDGGILNHPALVQGDDGDTPQIDTTINFTPIPAGDATPDFASWTETSPNVYKLNLGLHVGADGTNAGDTLDPADFGVATAGRMLVVGPGGTSFVTAAQKTPTGSFLPASITAVPSGNPSFTLCTIPVDAQPYDWYPEVSGAVVTTGTGADVRADLFARLLTTGISNAETAGPVVARGFGPIGVNAAGIATNFHAARPAGSSASYGKVLAGNAATIYIRLERQAGSNTFTTVADTSVFEVTPRAVM